MKIYIPPILATLALFVSAPWDSQAITFSIAQEHSEDGYYNREHGSRYYHHRENGYRYHHYRYHHHSPYRSHHWQDDG
jgi:hypothetical protein